MKCESTVSWCYKGPYEENALPVVPCLYNHDVFNMESKRCLSVLHYSQLTVKYHQCSLMTSNRHHFQVVMKNQNIANTYTTAVYSHFTV